MHTVKLPYGKKDDELVHVKAVERGDACGCICPKCESPLRAAKGEHNIEHFRHVNKHDCEGAAEFALREKLIQLFEDEGQITLPESRGKVDGEERVLVEQETVQIESIQTASGGSPFAPRFVIQTRSQDEREQRITAVVNMGAGETEIEDTTEPIVEINLADLGDDYSVERLIQAVVRATGCIRWEQRPRADARKAELIEEVRKIRTTEAEKEKLLREAKIRKPVEAPKPRPSYGADYFAPKADVKYEPEPKLPDTSSFGLQYANIEFTCDECGETGLTYDHMQRYKPSLGTGVCYNCKGVRRANGHLHNDYIGDQN
jgi:hypothetical protein